MRAELIEQLEVNVKELEEILRQLREEEIERVLAMLEGRFRQMLERELRVYEGTKKLNRIPAAQRGNEVDIQAGKVSIEQHKIAIEKDPTFDAAYRNWHESVTKLDDPAADPRFDTCADGRCNIDTHNLALFPLLAC